MQFLNPNALWLISLVPVLVIIHLLRSRKRRLQVGNLFLWQEVLSDQSRGIRLRRALLNNLTLLFQILMVLLASLALAKPVRFDTAPGRGDMILVMDTSASMQTRTGSGTRFDLARRAAHRLIDDLGAERRMMVIAAGRQPDVRSPFWDDRDGLHDLLDEIRPTDEPGRLIKAVYTALSFVEPGGDDRVVVITDGAGGQYEDIVSVAPRIEPLWVGGGQRNVGITRFEFRQTYDAENSYEMMLEVKNYTSEPIECPLRLSFDDTEVYSETLKLDAMGKQLMIFPYSGLLAGTATAHLPIEDDFPLDNRAHSILKPSEDIWVLLVSEGNYYLEKLLAAYPNLKVNTVREIIPSSWQRQLQHHDLVIVDRMPAPEIAEGNVLLIDAYSPSLPIRKGGRVKRPEVLDWNRNHPVMSRVDLRGLGIEEASVVTVAEDLRPLVEASQTGLVYTIDKPKLKVVFIGFDIGQSDLPFRSAFPVLMSNILQWLYPHKLMFSTAQVQAGQPIPIHFEGPAKVVTVRRPSGIRETLIPASNPIRYTRTHETGLYQVTDGRRRRHFAVNLVDEVESDIRVPLAGAKGSADRPARPPDAPSAEAAREIPLWRFFVLAAAGILLAEWASWLKNR